MGNKGKIHESGHPLMQVYLTQARDKNTQTPQFRDSIISMTKLLVFEATSDLQLKKYKIDTPLTSTDGFKLKEKLAVIPVLRAGLGMCETFLDIVEDAHVWHLGMYRDEETLEPVSYYNKLPKNSPPDIAYVVDPMLATGGTLLAVLQELKKWGVKKVSVISIIAAPEGLEVVTNEFPDIEIFVGKIDEKLTKDDKDWPDGFIWPGLGDAGDRLYGTH